MKRDEFSKKTRREAWDRSGHRCELCGTFLVGKPKEYDHKTEDYFGGSNSLDNCRVLCVACHGGRTRERAAVIAKSRRIRNKEAGIKKKTKFRGWRRMNGDIVFNRRD
jgi:5-methylcytosine-specific restriction protein A